MARSEKLMKKERMPGTPSVRLPTLFLKKVCLQTFDINVSASAFVSHCQGCQMVYFQIKNSNLGLFRLDLNRCDLFYYWSRRNVDRRSVVTLG
jgi:hypothetical protein